MATRRVLEIMQFKVVLADVKPQVWRRIQVPSTYTFWDLHVAIQDAMGWLDYHLHEFSFRGEEGEVVNIGIPDDDSFDDRSVIPGWETSIAEYFGPSSKEALYEYDFGDDWKHIVTFEKRLPADPATKYPVCIEGKRRCPPEDCGGAYGYARMLRILANPKHEEHEDTLTWVGGTYDPKAFDPRAVRFDNPKKRWKLAFESDGM